MFGTGYLRFLVIGFVLCVLSDGISIFPGERQSFVPGPNHGGLLNPLPPQTSEEIPPHQQSREETGEQSLRRQRKDDEFKDETTLPSSVTQENIEPVRVLPDLKNDSVPINGGDDDIHSSHEGQGQGHAGPNIGSSVPLSSPEPASKSQGSDQREHQEITTEPVVNLGEITDSQPDNVPGIDTGQNIKGFGTETYPLINSLERTTSGPDVDTGQHIHGFGTEPLQGGKIEQTESVVNLPEVTDSLPIEPGQGIGQEGIVTESAAHRDKIDQQMPGRNPTEAGTLEELTQENNITLLNHVTEPVLPQNGNENNEPHAGSGIEMSVKPEILTEPPPVPRETEKIHPKFQTDENSLPEPTEILPENMNSDLNATAEPELNGNVITEHQIIETNTLSSTSNLTNSTSDNDNNQGEIDHPGEPDQTKNSQKHPSNPGPGAESTTKRRNFIGPDVTPTPKKEGQSIVNESSSAGNLQGSTIPAVSMETHSTSEISSSFSSEMLSSQNMKNSLGISSTESTVLSSQNKNTQANSATESTVLSSSQNENTQLYSGTESTVLSSSQNVNPQVYSRTHSSILSSSQHENTQGYTRLVLSSTANNKATSTMKVESREIHSITQESSSEAYQDVSSSTKEASESLLPSSSIASPTYIIESSATNDYSKISSKSAIVEAVTTTEISSEIQSTKTTIVYSSQSTVDHSPSVKISSSPSVAYLPLTSDELVINPKSSTSKSTIQISQSSMRLHTSETTTPGKNRTTQSSIASTNTTIQNTTSFPTTTTTQMKARTTKAKISEIGTKNPSKGTEKPPEKTTKPELTPTPQLHPRTSTRGQSQNPTEFIQISLIMTLTDFCSKKGDFMTELVKVIDNEGSRWIDEKQIVLMNMHPIHCEEIIGPFGKGSNNEVTEIMLDIYIQDDYGNVDIDLTESCYTVIKPGFHKLQDSQFKIKYVNLVTQSDLGVGKQPPSTGIKAKSKGMEPGITIAIVIASVGGACCVALLILQLIIHRRSIKRMKPYFPGAGRYSIRSLDSIALDAVPKSRPHSGFWNAGLEQEEPPETTEPSHPLSYNGLSNFIRDAIDVDAEFETLPHHMPRLSCVPVGAEDKNRFANVIPHPHTRVKLKKLPDEDHSDYINANFVTGYNCDHKAYIATQDPLKNTVNDFWRMVWEQQSRVILMLTPMDERGQPRCTPYWPDSDAANSRKQYGDFIVALKKKEVNQEYTMSVLELKDIENNLIREIHHFWYTCWPIDGTPEPISFVKFVLDTRSHYEDSGAPVIVHCSPGTGRTGSLIVLDICMRSYESTRRVDVVNVIHRMRQERAGVVQTKNQYQLIYKALNEYATVMSSPSISANSSVVTLHNML